MNVSAPLPVDVTDKPPRGCFITLEGGEGAGKTTQIKRILDQLEARGIKAIATREPGGSPHAEIIREILLSGKAKPLGAAAEAVLFCAARIDHLDTKIRPALARGEWVVCDRFADSTRAYQGALGNLDPRFMAALERVTVGADVPDLTLVLDLPPEIGLARATARRGKHEGADRFEAEDVSFHQALRKAFLDIAAASPERCLVINATQSPDEVGAAIWHAIEARLLPPLPKASA